MKIFLNIFSFLSVFFLISCNKIAPQKALSKISNIEEIIVDPQDGAFLPLDSIVRQVNYIKLTLNDENLIGEISQILFVDSLLIVIDNEVAKSVNVFDHQGNFKYSIGQRGNGPGEFVEPTHVCIMPNEKKIAVLDRPQKRVLYFDYNGNFAQMERTPFMLEKFEYLQSGSKAFSVSGMKDPALGKFKENTLIVTDSDNSILYGACHDYYDANRFTYVMNSSLWKYADQVFFSPNFSDTIYSVKEDSLIAKYYINIKENKIPAINEHTTNEVFENNSETYYYFNGNFIELSDFSIINIFTPHGCPFVLYSHKSKKTFLNNGYSNHPFSVFLEKIPLTRYQNNCVVGVAHSHMILAQKANMYKSGVFDEILDPLFEGLTEDSNPVLFFYYINDKL